MTALRVNLVHSRYSSRWPSGENSVVDAEVEALTRAGVDVVLSEVGTDETGRRPAYLSRSAIRVATGLGRAPDLDRDADVIHIHNLFPHFGHQWLEDVVKPVVWTIHNFRLRCASGDLFREDAHCQLCLDRRVPTPALRYGCAGNRLQTVPLAVRQATRGLERRVAEADAVVSISRATTNFIGRIGLKNSVLQPHFVPDSLWKPHRPLEPVAGGQFLLVGKLSPEKGIEPLLRNWPKSRRLVVIGDGPIRERLRALSPASVEFLGRKARENVVRHMAQSTAVVVPSTAIETFGLVGIEAMSVGTPVVAFRPNTVAQRVEVDGTGIAVSWGSDLDEVLGSVEDRQEEFYARCIEEFHDTFSESQWVERRTALYESLLEPDGS